MLQLATLQSLSLLYCFLTPIYIPVERHLIVATTSDGLPLHVSLSLVQKIMILISRRSHGLQGSGQISTASVEPTRALSESRMVTCQ